VTDDKIAAAMQRVREAAAVLDKEQRGLVELQAEQRSGITLSVGPSMGFTRDQADEVVRLLNVIAKSAAQLELHQVRRP
jgi:hypothetical protein